MGGVREFYAHKNVLLTGTTGFVGKVVLEKLLRTVPDIGTIYVLIRNKEGSNPIERFKKNVLGTACFDKLKKIHSNKFDEFINYKVIPVGGDLDKEELNISPSDLEILIANVHVVLNVAGAVDFDAPLGASINTNVQGAMRMLDLCKKIKNLQSFVHVSTCYVNSDKKGIVEEKIYLTSENPDIVLNEILNVPAGQLESRTRALIGEFPNTYTFAKALGERMLQKHRENIPLTIVRPAIIGSSWRDPFPGWVDTVSAAGALYLMGGIGLIQVAHGNKNIIGDQVPVDFVADSIIVSAAFYANNPELQVLHCGTSGSNPVSWGFSTKVGLAYWKAYPPQKKVADCHFRLQKNKKLLKAEQFVRRAPVYLYYKSAQAIQNRKMKRSAGKLYQGLLRAEQLSDLFEYFVMNEWIFVTNHYEELLSFCTPEERSIFQLDTKEINWKKYLTYFMWGLHRFILKENVDPPAEVSRSDVLLSSGSGTIPTIKWAMSHGLDVDIPPPQEYKAIVLGSQRVKDVIKNIVINKQGNMSDGEFEALLYKQAAKHCDFIFSNFNVQGLRMAAVLTHKILKSVYEKLVIDESKILPFKENNPKVDGPLIFIPTHRSYLDFVILSYIFFALNIRIPQIVSAEDFLKMAIIPHIFRSTGAFFIRRKRTEYYEIYNAVLYEYIQRLIMTENSLEFFIEGTRSRYGKTLGPKFGILSIVVDTYLEKKIPNAQIVPITINYDKLIEGDSYPYELLGEPKVKESLTRMIKAADVLNMNFGKVYFEVGEPLPLDKYVQNFEKSIPNLQEDHWANVENRVPLVKKLGQEIVYQLNDNLVVMPTAMISSLLLVHRKGISEESLSEKAEWLMKQILMRGGKIGSTDENHSFMAIRGAIGLIEHLVEQKKDVFHLRLSAREDYKNIIMLSFYRNGVGHIFWNEAIIACALASFGHDIAWKEGVSIERLWEEVSFLHSLMYREYQMRNKITQGNFAKHLELMAERGVIRLEKNGDSTLVKVNAESGEMMMSYLCNFIWPFVASYWVSAVYLFSIRNKAHQTSMKRLLVEVQWFAESMFDERIIEFYESCTLDTLKNALGAFKEVKIITVTKKMTDKTQGVEEIMNLNVGETELKEFEAHIKKFLKSSFATSVSSLIDIARNATLNDYLNMSKL